jgi:Tfp pilus assembly protein PilO
MINYALIERNKDTIVNVGIVIVALFIAFHFYRSTETQVSALRQAQSAESEKNKVIADIAALEKKAETYQKFFVKRDLASIMDVISSIAKTTSVKINSVKPSTEEVRGTYFNSSYLIALNAHSYHALGEFISKIENLKDVYLISDVNITSIASTQDVTGGNTELGVTLKINIISYL